MNRPPFNYALCLQEKCPQSSSCLRFQCYQQLDQTQKTVKIINPVYLRSLTGTCPLYRPHVKVAFAKGFANMLHHLPQIEADAISQALEAHYGHSMYYRMRRGTRLIDPHMQDEILGIVARIGTEKPFQFDAFVEQYDWTE